MKKLVLFDIDGTILRSNGSARGCMEQALITVFGTAGDPAYRYDGKTDKQIAREQMRGAGFDDATIDARMNTLLDHYLHHLGTALDAAPDTVWLCRGVETLLDAVDASHDAVMGLLTGNVHAGAERKLRAVGLGMERFRVNAFGSDHEHRPELPGVAVRRAHELLGVVFPGDDVVIIGDTPSDIHCGRPIGARTIGVASGSYSTEELQQHDPFAVFADLTDTERVLDAIFR